MEQQTSPIPVAAANEPLRTPAKLTKPSTSNSSSESAKRNTPAKGTPLRPQAAGGDVTGGLGGGESDDEDGEEDEGPSLETMKAFGRQIQRAPTTKNSAAAIATKVVIPKRGEKDFEPLNQTATIQEKMLRESRQALFDGFSGVRGTNSVYPQVQIVRGNLFITIGHTIRPPYNPADKGKSKPQAVEAGSAGMAQAAAAAAPAKEGGTSAGAGSTMELLPEEALYLLERGSMQIWCTPSAYAYGSISQTSESNEDVPASSEDEAEKQEMEESREIVWDDGVQGFRGMVEMTAMEGFARFIGQDGLTLERYQVYAGLKRLGYTVHRTAQFLPPRFQKPANTMPIPTTATATAEILERSSVSPLRWIIALRAGLMRVVHGFVAPFRWLSQQMVQLVRRLTRGRVRDEESQTLLGTVRATGYGALYEKLRIVPSGHGHPVTVPDAQSSPSSQQALKSAPKRATTNIEPSATANGAVDPFTSLAANPYLPFFHVWKPNTHWTRGKWDRGSAEGLKTLPPDFWIAVVDARSVPFPTLPQLEAIFPTLPAIPKPFIRSRAPMNTAITKQDAAKPASSSFLHRILSVLRLRQPQESKAPTPQVNTFLALKQGDRSLIIAVVDGGNVGWTRLGRGGFEDHIMVPNEML
ncbi:hypothetical protein QFC21_006782 [Naganishia friedmannii]|uniref:Uncharacterized protein n=1 Tax=Naganishia friedmannii TaxID=89922 RepID=A0ACC2V123_9TREE|nr:hypothetical protein QFC21_006782 [Naganishia friedmannii]